jgi:predicted nuclease of predicted toxin-antitoxin system
VKLLIDEMLSASIAEQLRQRGRDAVAVDEQRELRGLSDAELFAHAQEAGRVVVTYNRDDFIELTRDSFAAGRPHAGVLILTRKLPRDGARRARAPPVGGQRGRAIRAAAAPALPRRLPLALTATDGARPAR